jgi:Mitochondrial ribosomal subunit protein
MSSTAALQQLLVRTANGGAGAAALRSLASISSSLASALTTTTSTTTRPAMTISSTSSRCSQYNRSFSFAAATGAKSMMMFTNTSSSSTSNSSNSSYLDSILDPSAPASLFGDEESSEPVLRSNKFLKCGISENALRFKTQSYGRLLQAPFVHANEHRVTLLVRLDALPFTHQLEHDILQEIVGIQRYNVERNELLLQSVQFASRIENKRHLVSMLDRLVLSCQSLAKQVMEEEQESNEMKDVV